MRRAETNYDAQDQYAWKNHRHHRLGRFALTQTPGGAPPGPPRWATVRVTVTNSQTHKQGSDDQESKRERTCMNVFNELVANQVFIFRQDKIFYTCMNKCRIPGAPPGPPVGRRSGLQSQIHKLTNSEATTRNRNARGHP
jgi:hypothetical protein